jgi:hypothetical protein
MEVKQNTKKRETVGRKEERKEKTQGEHRVFCSFGSDKRTTEMKRESSFPLHNCMALCYIP